MCIAGTVVASWSLTQEAAGSSPFTVMIKIFLSEFRENIQEKLHCDLLLWNGLIQWSRLSFKQRETNIGFIWHTDSLFLCLIYDAVRTSSRDSVNNDPSPASISLNLFASSYPRAVLSSNLLNFPGHCACSLWKTCEAVDLSWLVVGTGFYWCTTTCQLTESIDGPRVLWPWR